MKNKTYSLQATNHFSSQLKKLAKSLPRQKIEHAFFVLANNPFQVQLKTHIPIVDQFATKIMQMERTNGYTRSHLLQKNDEECKVQSKKNGLAYSSSVTGDIRIIWQINTSALTILLLDIGSHSGSHKVYK